MYQKIRVHIFNRMIFAFFKHKFDPIRIPFIVKNERSIPIIKSLKKSMSFQVILGQILSIFCSNFLIMLNMKWIVYFYWQVERVIYQRLNVKYAFSFLAQNPILFQERFHSFYFFFLKICFGGRPEGDNFLGIISPKAYF